MIEAKISEMDRDPQNIQVTLARDERGTSITLRDASGVFLEVVPPTREEEGEETDSARSSDSDEHEKSVQELRAELKEMTKQREKSEGEVSELTKPVGRLTNELGSMKVRIDELWKANCAQMNEWDTVLTAKEDEIGRLKVW